MAVLTLFTVLNIIAYLFGSICSAVIVCNIFSLPDPRTTGSNNPGATNVLRIAGKKYAALVLFVDLLKGVLPVLLAKMVGAGPSTLVFVCFAAVLGHMFPIFFSFRGGKGVATAMGGIIGLNWLLGGIIMAIWFVVANYTLYASLASIIAISLAPLLAAFITHGIAFFMPLLAIAIFVIFKHRDNITRLFDGEEPKIKSKGDTLEEEVSALLDEECEEEFLENKELSKEKKVLGNKQVKAKSVKANKKVAKSRGEKK